MLRDMGTREISYAVNYSKIRIVFCVRNYSIVFEGGIVDVLLLCDIVIVEASLGHLMCQTTVYSDTLPIAVQNREYILVYPTSTTACSRTHFQGILADGRLKVLYHKKCISLRTEVYGPIVF